MSILKQVFQSESKPQAPKEKDYTLVVDFSYSMCYELPRIRDYVLEAIKNKVPFGSTFSIAYFSGNGEYGTIIERFAIDEKMDKKYLEKKLKDKFHPIGATTFTGGLIELEKILSSGTPDRANIVEFITDGYDNGSTTANILSLVEKASKLCDSFTVVEFGNYCNHNLLVQMSDKASENCQSRVAYSKNHQALNDNFEDFINQNFIGDKVIVEAPEGYTYACVGLSQYKVVDGKASIPKSDVVYFIKDGSLDNDNLTTDEYYLLAFHSAYRMYPQLAFDCLSKTGDVNVWNKYNNAIGQQRLNEALAYMSSCVSDVSKRGNDGYSSSLVSKEDAFSVLDALELLQSDKEAKFYPYKSYGFDYSPITQPKVQATKFATEEEKVKLQEAIDKGDWETVKTLSEGKFELKFILKEEAGIPFGEFVFNEGAGRANLSVNAFQKGTVSLTPVNKSHLPLEVETHRYRNYSLISDGNVNVDRLPFTASESTLSKLREENCIEQQEGFYYLLLEKLPVVNRNSAKNILAKELIGNAWEMTKLKGEIKVVKDFIKNLYGDKVDTNLETLYGTEIALELKELGFTYNGFAPKTVSIGTWGEEPYSYLKIDFRVGAKGGLFTLPSVNAVQKKISEGKKLNIAETIMKGQIDNCEGAVAMVNGDVDKIKKFLEGNLEMLNYKKRSLEYKVAKTQFALLLTKKWFADIDSECREVVVSDSIHGDVTGTIEYGTTEAKQ